MTSSDLARATAGEDLPVDYSAIEKSLADLWRSEKDGEHAVMRAALWNVVVHTQNPKDHSNASQTLARASEEVPQRAIVIRADVKGASEISSWISANCHLVGGEKQVCSEEIAIVAGGARVRHVPPLVDALLIPDMPLAVWWVGDVPNEAYEYVERLLDTADRLIVDSAHFNSVMDLKWLRAIGEKTFTAPADLNWVRLEEWRVATASLFDPFPMRERLRKIRQVHVVASGDRKYFGHTIESRYFAAWIVAQTGNRDIKWKFDLEQAPDADGMLVRIRITFEDGSEASVSRDATRHVLLATMDGTTQTFDCVTRVLGRGMHELIVRQLKRNDADAVFAKVLPIAIELAP